MRFVYVGIDAAKDRHVAEARDRGGNVLLPAFSFSADLEGIEELLSRVTRIAEKLEATPLFGMEATGIYHLGLYAELKKRGFHVRVYNPLQLRAFRKKSIRKTITDKTSCSALAEMLRYDTIPAERKIPPEVLKLREYCRARHRLVKKLRVAKTQLRRDVSIVFKGYEHVFRRLTCRSSKRLLRQCPTPRQVLELGAARIEEILREEGDVQARKKARRLVSEASRAAREEALVEPCVYETRMLLQEIEHLEAQLRRLESEIERLFSAFEESRLYTSVKGVSMVTGAVIFSNFGSLRDFPHPDKAVAFAGLDPSVVESGRFKGGWRHLSKRGSPYLRQALYQAANAAVHFNPVLAAVYRRKRRQGLSHRAAVCVAARKLVHVLHSVVVNGMAFHVPSQMKEKASS